MRAVARRPRMPSAPQLWASLRSSASRSVVLESVFLLPVVLMGVRTIGWMRMHRLLDRPGPKRSSLEEARRITVLVEAVARRGPIRYSCLHRSAVLWRILRRRGLEAELRFGVRKEAPGNHRFHAWVEHADQVLNDVPSVRERFTTFGAAPNGKEAS